MFDLDGTLVESRYAISSAVNVTLGRFKLPQLGVAFVQSTIGRPVREVFAKSSQNPDLVDSMVQSFREELAVNGHKLTTVIPGVLQTLEVIRSYGIVMAIASNKPSELSNIVLSQLGLRDFFSYITGPDLVQPKPSSDMLVNIAETLKTKVFAMVGDTEDDIRCAKNYGVKGLLYCGDKQPFTFDSQDLFPIVFRNFHELPELINSIERGSNV